MRGRDRRRAQCNLAARPGHGMFSGLRWRCTAWHPQRAALARSVSSRSRISGSPLSSTSVSSLLRIAAQSSFLRCRAATPRKSVHREQYLNVAIFGTEFCKQRDVNVARKSQLAPTNDGNAANETRSPLSHPNEVLQVCDLLNEPDQRTNRPKSRCGRRRARSAACAAGRQVTEAGGPRAPQAGRRAIRISWLRRAWHRT